MNKKLTALISLLAIHTASAATITYDLTFEGRWLSDSGTTARPSNAHFSPFVAVTHNNSANFFTAGSMASAGIEDLAETGATGDFLNEITAAGINADSPITRSGISGAQESFTIRFTADSDRPLLTLATMIAPSPDWFVGLSNFSLLNGSGNFINSATIDLNSYDAGTEQGTTFSTNNSESNPRSNIQLLDTAEPNGALFGAGSIARITLTQVPEPSSTLLLGLGSLALLTRRRR